MRTVDAYLRASATKAKKKKKKKKAVKLPSELPRRGLWAAGCHVADSGGAAAASGCLYVIFKTKEAALGFFDTLTHPERKSVGTHQREDMCMLHDNFCRILDVQTLPLVPHAVFTRSYHIAVCVWMPRGLVLSFQKLTYF